MADTVFYAEDAEGTLRRWRPSADMMRGQQMAYAIRGGSALNDTPTLIEFLADRLVKVYGENKNTDYILEAKVRAEMMKNALPPRT